MRLRTVLATTTSAMLIGLWSAPAALAAEAPDNDPPPPSSSAAPEPSGGDSDKDKAGPNAGVVKDKVKAPEVPAPPVNPESLQKKNVPQLVEPKAVLALSRTEAKPGEKFVAVATCTAGTGTLSASRDVSFSGTTGTVADAAAEGDITVTLKCVLGDKSDEATKTFKVLPKDNQDQNKQGPGSGPIVDPGKLPGPPPGVQNQARLSVPSEVFPGDRFTARVQCLQGGRSSLGGQFVRFNGLDGVVDEAAQEGRFGVTLRCSNNDEVTEFFYVKRKPIDLDGRARINLNPNSGKRGDDVDIRAYCPGDGHGRFESDGLDDVNLHLDGGWLRGETHVEKNANFGKTSGRLICDNGDRDWDRFYVERDEHDRFLDLDLNHGHRGDDVDVRVHCDRDLKDLESDVLKDIKLDRDGDDWWKFSGTTHVQDDAEYGEHTVRIKCGDDWLEDDFFVQGGSSKGDSDKGDSGEQTGLYPEGGVETGGGPSGGAPYGAVALGLTGVLGAALAGAGAVAEGRGAR
jgi:hypothetical protein